MASQQQHTTLEGSERQRESPGGWVMQTYVGTRGGGIKRRMAGKTGTEWRVEEKAVEDLALLLNWRQAGSLMENDTLMWRMAEIR